MSYAVKNAVLDYLMDVGASTMTGWYCSDTTLMYTDAFGRRAFVPLDAILCDGDD